ncbi:MAG: hypothetical protein IJJ33_12720 [Victivallales bacterium]|nr:hypothetical protein [Victivallales bacterium]
MKKNILVFLTLACLSAFAAVDPISVQKLELRPGWNLVTLTRSLTAESALHFLKLHPMTLDVTGMCYVQCTGKDDLKVGVGYWVFSRTPQQTIELVHDLAQTSYETADLTAGWNLIGVAETSTWQTLATKIWQWVNGHYQSASQEELAAGKAYWVNQ